MRHGLFQWAVLLLGLLLVSCAPRVARHKLGQLEGTYMVSSNRLYEDDGDFDIRKEVVFYRPDSGPNVIETNIPTPQFTLNRCGRCHECGFNAAWDRDRLGTPEWKPRYRGEAWGPIVQRMRVMEDSLLNSMLADRIYTYLRDASLGVYDESLDAQGAVVREVDELPEEIVIESPGTAERKRATGDSEDLKDSDQPTSPGPYV